MVVFLAPAFSKMSLRYCDSVFSYCRTAILRSSDVLSVMWCLSSSSNLMTYVSMNTLPTAMMSSSKETSGSSSRNRMSSSRKSLTATLFSSIFSGGSNVLSLSISSIISWMSWFSRSISSSALSLSSSLVLTAFWRDCRSFCSASSCLMRCSRCLRSDSKSERMCSRDLRSASSCFCSADLSLPSAASWSCSCFTCFSPCTIFSCVSLCARFSASSFSFVSPWDLASLSSSDLSCSMELRRASSCVRRSCRLRLNCDCSAVC
mmetsp:Transcript_6234/g.28114  ORF Transcript_6234/g.28114 Transcript_6234/m.28114 type:complete len:262 (-) Transcript_6234:1224-2009(-)